MENDFKYVNKGKYFEIEVNGKNIKADAKYIAKQMEVLDMDEEDAIYMFLEDEGIFENEEQNELDAEAKANKPKDKADKKIVKKSQKERVVKANPEKEGLIADLAKALGGFGNVEDIVIENKGKIINFRIGDQEYKLDLVAKRKPKENK